MALWIYSPILNLKVDLADPLIFFPEFVKTIHGLLNLCSHIYLSCSEAKSQPQ